MAGSEAEEASWGWALQQTFEKALKAWLQHLGINPPHSHDIARLLLLLEQAGIDVNPLLPRLPRRPLQPRDPAGEIPRSHHCRCARNDGGTGC